MPHHPNRHRRIGALALIAICLAAPVRAEDDDCAVPMADWQPRAAVSQMAAEHGWTVRRIKIDDGCYKIYGKDAKGRPVEVTVNPATLAILEIELEDDHGAGSDAHEDHDDD